MTGFATRHPRVWHVMEAEGEGCAVLHPAATLCRLAGQWQDGANRNDFQRLILPDGTAAVLRLQLMRDERLAPTLAGRFSGRPDLWRAHIDRHVFFWVSPDRRNRFLNACARLRAKGAMGAGAAPVVIELETAALLAAHGAHAFFSTINSGSTLRGGARTRRDETTLRPLADWRGERVAELAVCASVPLAGGAAPFRPSGDGQGLSRVSA